MGFNSQSGQVGFGVQTLRGTPVAATRFARLRGGSLGGDRALLIPDAEIGGNRDIANAYMGPVTFGGDLEFYPRMQMAALLMFAASGAKSSTSVAGTTEVQSIATTGTPTGGTFKLRFRGATTTALNWNSAAAAIQTALQALPTIGAGNVTTGGGPLPTAVTVTFAGSLVQSNPPQLEAVEVALTGGTSPTVAITTTTPGLPTIGTHVITPADTLPWVTVEERVGNEFESFRYVDAKVHALHLEAEAAGYLMGTATLNALTMSSGFVEQTTPAWDQTPLIVGGQISVKWNGTLLPAKSFSFDVTSNPEVDDFRLGSIFAADIVEKRREVKAGVSYRPNDANLWKAAMYGSEAVSTPQAGPAYKGACEILMTTFETIGDVVAGTPYSLKIDIPYATIAPFKINPSGDDTLQADLEITAIRPEAAVPIYTCTVVNDLANVT